MIIFYSWQSDSNPKTNHYFIEEALKKAAKNIRNDDSINVEPVIDRDTKGTAGAVNIAETIFKKIENSQIFVCDVSIINSNAGSESRKTPNPNVLYELGFATKTLGENQIILVMNTAFGKPEDLPFDLRMKRVLTYAYSTPENDENKSNIKKNLGEGLEDAIRTIIEKCEFNRQKNTAKEISIFEETLAAIENEKPNRKILLKKYLKSFIEEIDKTNKIYFESEKRTDSIIEAINASESFLIEFAKISEAVSLVKDFDIAKMVYDNFAEFIDRYEFNGNGRYHTLDFDYYKFIGHELFVIFISFLVKDSNWEFVAKLLANKIYIQNNYQRQPELVPFGYICQHVEILEIRDQSLETRFISPRSNALHSQITESRLQDVIPMSQFTETDLFLFLYSQFNKNDGSFYLYEWYVQSFVHLSRSPKFLIEAYSKQKTLEFMKVLNVQDIEEFKRQLTESIQLIRRSSIHLSFLSGFNLNLIATQ
jgi:DNA-binding XRE family transcriptional regulator